MTLKSRFAFLTAAIPFLLAFSPPKPPPEPAPPEPARRTVFVMQAPDDSNVKDDKLSKADGIVLRIKWATVEPVRNGGLKLDWLKSELARAKRMKKLVQLVILAGDDAPSWLSAAGAKVVACPNGKIPLPWDTVFQSEYARFVGTLANAIEHTNITHVHSIGADSAEWHYVTNAPNVYTAPGFSNSAMIQAHVDAVSVLKAAFPTSVVVVDIGDHAKDWTRNAISELKLRGGRIGFQMNSMSAKTSLDYAGYTRIRDAAVSFPAGFEMVGPSVGADGKPVERFGGPFSEATRKMDATQAQWEIRYQWDL